MHLYVLSQRIYYNALEKINTFVRGFYQLYVVIRDVLLYLNMQNLCGYITLVMRWWEVAGKAMNHLYKTWLPDTKAEDFIYVNLDNASYFLKFINNIALCM